MALREITGASPSELETLRDKYYNTPQYLNHGIPFDLAYCLNKIPRQPDHYDGPERFCKQRAAKKNEDDYIGDSTDKAAFAVCCHSHGGHVTKHGHKYKHKLEDPRTARITHGAYADDEHLKMDFDENEQKLYDSIIEDWPDIYNWPPRSEDPARYRILRRIAVNEVRSMREEEYLDGHEVHEEPIFDDQGVQVGSKEVENPLAREYRLLMSEITNQMRELGLTPKEQQKMDSLSAKENKDDAISDIATEALQDEERGYDPERFND
jgi:hypothetical protein